MARPFSLRLSAAHRLVALMVLLALGIGALFGRTLWTLHDEEWSFARTTNANLVRTLEQSMARTLGGIDRSMVGMVEQLASAQVVSLEPGLRAGVLFDHSLRIPVIASVAVLDELGYSAAQIEAMLASGAAKGA